MMSIGTGICRNCGSVNVEHMDGFAFYATLCFFCGELYSRDTIVYEDYYEAMLSRQIPEYKDNYEDIITEREGKGVAFFAAKDNETINSKYLEDEYVDFHKSSEEYGNGVLLIKGNEPDSWYEDMIKEIETNSDIDKDRSYVTKFDKELILLYGDEELFLQEIEEVQMDYGDFINLDIDIDEMEIDMDYGFDADFDSDDIPF